MVRLGGVLLDVVVYNIQGVKRMCRLCAYIVHYCRNSALWNEILSAICWFNDLIQIDVLHEKGPIEIALWNVQTKVLWQ